MGKTIPLPKEAEPLPVPLDDHIRSALTGVESLRAQVADLRAERDSLYSQNLVLDSEVQSLKMQLESERSERRHYQSFCVEIVTRIDIADKALRDVVERAGHEVYRRRREHPHEEPQKLADIEVMPDRLETWLKNNPALAEHAASAEEACAAA